MSAVETKHKGSFSCHPCLCKNTPLETVESSVGAPDYHAMLQHGAQHEHRKL